MSGHCNGMRAGLKLAAVVSAWIEAQAFGRVAVEAMRGATLAVL